MNFASGWSRQENFIDCVVSLVEVKVVFIPHPFMDVPENSEVRKPLGVFDLNLNQ
jgi:hypothetical protein